MQSKPFSKLSKPMYHERRLSLWPDNYSKRKRHEFKWKNIANVLVSFSKVFDNGGITTEGIFSTIFKNVLVVSYNLVIKNKIKISYNTCYADSRNAKFNSQHILPWAMY